MEKSFIRNRTVEINGRIFDVLINQAEKFITVRGIVEDWEEKDWVEQYFRLRAPSDYHLNYEITLIIDNKMFKRRSENDNSSD
jgi:hypothetical protein